ncbi:MAG: Eco57I restriction-modification methylase domain-containing protein, partial [Halorhabdus sp.]
GVDLNPLATELARLSIWVHTFVPGLPLTFLDYNLVTGDSLAGIGTLDEVTDILDVEQTSLGMFTGGSSVMDEIRDDIDQLGSFADASAEQVAEARETREEIERNLEQVRARFDILAASRIDEDIDTDPVSDTEIDITDEECYEQAQEVLESTDPLHFPAAFPEVFDGEDAGFDAILGNPPWEQAKIERDEFWRRHYPGLSGLTKNEREEKISELENERPDLDSQLDRERKEQRQRSQILINGPYPDMGRGDPDLYQGFSWRFWRLISQGGHVGVVLPRAAFISPGAETLRYEILDSGNIHDLTFLKNERGWVFENVEPRYTVALFSLQKEPTIDSQVPIRGPYTDPESYEQGIEDGPTWFPVEEAKAWAGSAKFPLLPPAEYAGPAFKQLTTSPGLSSKEESWQAVPYREDIAHDEPSGDDVETDPDRVPDNFWPVFKGASINPPNEELWVTDTGKRYAWVDQEAGKEYLQQKRENAYPYSNSPMSEMPESWVKDKTTLPCLYPRVAVRKVARNTDQRTLRPSLIPPNTFLNNTLIYFLWPETTEREIDEAYLLGVLNTIPADWYARRFVETHLTFQVIRTFPVPRPGPENPLRQRVTDLSARLAAVDNRYAEWADSVDVKYGPLDEETKREKIYELDAVVAHLYGLSREHVEVIFETFHDGWDYEERLERVLDYYADWADRLDLDHADREEERAAGTRHDE